MTSITKKVKVLSGYRITIPKEIRERMKIKVGQEVTITAKGGEIIIKVFEEDPVFSLLGIAEGAPRKSSDDIFLEEISKKVKKIDVR